VAFGDSRGVDNGINLPVVKRLVDEIIKEKPALVLFSGDLINGYSPAETNAAQLANWCRNFMEPLLDKGIKVYPVRGNHEMTSDGAELTSGNVWRRTFGDKFALPDNGPWNEKKVTYSFTCNNALFLNLDTIVLKGQVNQGWIDTQLAGNKAIHVFTQLHVPLFQQKGGHKGGPQDQPQKRNALVDSLTKAGSVVLFCGDDHWYDHCTVPTNNMQFHQLTVGTGGAPLKSPASVMNYFDGDVKGVAHTNRYGYARVEIDGSAVNIKMKILNKDGTVTVVDEFSYVAGKSAIPARKD